MNRRRIEFEGAVNFRDLGGYPAEGGRSTRWRTIYRSDSLADLTESDVCDLQQLGIKTLCDFRLSYESERKPNRLPNGHRINVVLLPFIPEGTLDMLSAINRGQYGPADVEREVLDHYKKFVNDHASEYRRVFEVILHKDSLPLLMHCTSGKDRTGFAAAAVLLAVGVSREIIVRDYALTNDFRRDIRHLFSNAVSKPTIDVLTSANPRYLEAALDEIDARFGTTEAWLESLGLNPSRRARLRDLLTE
ncbi:MAG TPA: tyrosine-protein phosphatase [Bradyrhizobium sp.]